MCRIARYLDTNTNRSYDMHAIITSMRDAMRHGGPDAGLIKGKRSLIQTSPIGEVFIPIEDVKQKSTGSWKSPNNRVAGRPLRGNNLEQFYIH
jgi:hypothetical protein